MSISVKCKNCGRSYSVKDEHAGKKFRCQECQAQVIVPKAETFDADDWDAGEEGDEFGADTYDDYEDYGDYESAAPPPPRRAPKKKKKPAQSKKRPKKAARSSSASEIAPMIGKIGGGLFVGLIAFSLAFRLFGGGMDLGTNWEPYTTPDGNLTMLMPGKPKPVKVRIMAPGGQSVGVEKRNFACIIVIEPMPPEMRGMSEDEMFEAMKLGSQFLGATNAQTSTLNGHPCISFEQARDGIKATGKAVIHKDKIYTINYAYKGSPGSNQDKFFNSIEFN